MLTLLLQCPFSCLNYRFSWKVISSEQFHENNSHWVAAHFPVIDGQTVQFGTKKLVPLLILLVWQQLYTVTSRPYTFIAKPPFEQALDNSRENKLQQNINVGNVLKCEDTVYSKKRIYLAPIIRIYCSKSTHTNSFTLLFALDQLIRNRFLEESETSAAALQLCAVKDLHNN